MRARQYLVGILAWSIALSILPATTHGAATISPAFQPLWAQTDQAQDIPPVWGPGPFSELLDEAYAEGPGDGGYRLVQYFDKGRMELGPYATVTAGLLATELLNGTEQIGDTQTRLRTKDATIPVAGDPDNRWPTYKSLVKLRTAVKEEGNAVTRVYLPDGSFATKAESVADPATAYTTVDTVTGHALPHAFATFRNDPRHPLRTIGLAITEAFWATVRVGGEPKDVMMQAFERRVLTYTPTNPDPYKVEFGNIGQHYFRWRYSQDVSCGADGILVHD